jgi:hypothetical protein
VSDNRPRELEGRTSRPAMTGREVFLGVGVVLLLVLLALSILLLRSDQKRIVTQPVATAATAPSSCAEAVALADDLVHHAGVLADAGIGHWVLMEKLKLAIEGRRGGIDGETALRLGAGQVTVMSEHGPDVRATVRRYRAARKECPL